MMHVYSIEYGSYEDSDRLFFSHEEFYTKQEFDILVIGAIVFFLKAVKAGDIKNTFFGKPWHSPWPFFRNVADFSQRCTE